jgi:phosphohistidine phosphatase SixA
MRIGALILLFFCLAGVTGPAQADEHYTLYLVRHSEKLADDGDDPGLTGEGEQRSAQLANWLRDKGIEAIWSSDYRRSRDTAAPLVKMLDLPLQLYDPHNLAGLVVNLHENRRNALVVGHSNTTPDLARLLCTCYIRDMDDSDYDQLMVVTVTADGAAVEILSQASLFDTPGAP